MAFVIMSGDTYMGDLVKHAVLYWEDGKHQQLKPFRDDIGYFMCPKQSEADSQFYAQYKLGLLDFNSENLKTA